jgi:sulfite exporter TauE/SafE
MSTTTPSTGSHRPSRPAGLNSGLASPIDANSVWERLKQEYQPAAVEDERAAISLEVEQGRLIAYGALGTLAVAWTCAFQTDAKACLEYLKIASSVLILAASFGWTALNFSAASYSSRSAWNTRQMLERFDLAMGRDATANRVAREDASSAMHLYRGRSRLFSLLGNFACLAACPLLYCAASETLSGKCTASIWTKILGLWPF